jgi:hypothetical protein
MAYLEGYNKKFQHLRNQTITFFEIECGYPQSRQPERPLGICGSLPMWSKYFGPSSTIVGINIIPECKEFKALVSNIHVETGDQSDHQFLAQLVQSYGEPIAVLDHRPHRDENITASSEYSYPELACDRFYAIEDLGDTQIHAQNENYDWEGSFRFSNIASRKHILEINQAYTNRDRLRAQNKDLEFPATELGFITKSIEFLPNLVIYCKGVNLPIDQLAAPLHYTFSI